MYPEACAYLDLKHLFNSPFEKSIIERSMEYFKERTEILMITNPKEQGINGHYTIVKYPNRLDLE